MVGRRKRDESPFWHGTYGRIGVGVEGDLRFGDSLLVACLIKVEIKGDHSWYGQLHILLSASTMVDDPLVQENRHLQRELREKEANHCCMSGQNNICGVAQWSSNIIGTMCLEKYYGASQV